MSPWVAAQDITPWLTLLVGFAALVGLCGTGHRVSGSLRAGLPTGLTPLFSLTLGTLVFMALVWTMAALGVASRTALQSLWWAIVGFGIWSLKGVRWPTLGLGLLSLPALVTLGALVLVALCQAMLPSIHADDGYYHLLAPARLVADEGLRFYRYPLHSGVVSQMGYQLGAAPVHAMGVPQAWAVVGVGFWLSLVWFGIRQAQESGAGRAWSSIVALGLAAGLYPTAWYATAGAHAMGDVTFAAGVLLAARIPAPSLQGFAQLNLLLVAAACTKVSLLPMLLVTWLFALARTWAGLPRQKRLRLVLIALAPWLLWQGTALLWTWWQSGSPWGPYFAGLLGWSAYEPASVQQAFEAAIKSGRYPTHHVLLFTFGFINPVVWLACGAGLLRGQRAGLNWLFAILTLVQGVLIAGWLPLDPRYAGGLYLVALLAIASRPSEGVLRALKHPAGHLAAGLLLVPWALLGVADGVSAARTVAGLQEPSERMAQQIPLWETFDALDELLPEDACILALRHSGGAKLPNAYMPRHVALVPEDIPPGTRPFLLWVGSRRMDAVAEALDDYPELALGDALIPLEPVEWTTRGKATRRTHVGVYALRRATDSESLQPL